MRSQISSGDAGSEGVDGLLVILCKAIRSLQNRCESAFEEADLEDACEAEAAAFYGDPHGRIAGFSCWMRGFRRGFKGYGK